MRSLWNIYLFYIQVIFLKVAEYRTDLPKTNIYLFCFYQSRLYFFHIDNGISFKNYNYITAETVALQLTSFVKNILIYYYCLTLYISSLCIFFIYFTKKVLDCETVVLTKWIPQQCDTATWIYKYIENTVRFFNPY